jgi:TetR/AcrR family transcriptional repressor of mexJK operon
MAPNGNRDRVLRAATSAFLAHGYRSSVEQIARRARVAKQTVYHHFPSKDGLFKDVARELARRVLVELDEDPARLRATLVAFGRAYRQRVLGSQGIATFRAVVPEVPRFRALARAMYTASAGEMARRLAELIGRSMDEGRLRREDPRFAAELFLGMLVGHDRIRRLFAVPLAEEGEPARTERIVDCFLRAFQP